MVAEEELNAKLEAENVIIREKNALTEKTFNEERRAKIDALKSKMNVAQIADNSETIKILENEVAFLGKEVGALELSERELEKNKEKSKFVYSELAKTTGELLRRRDTFLADLADLEKNLNEQIKPFGFSCTLLSTTKGGEPTCDFRLRYLGDKYQSEAYRLLRNAKFCEMLAARMGSELPIFIDESQKIVNDEILLEIKKIKNVCLISANKDYKVLTINKL